MRVKTITIGRLFNLGSYEHIRYEVCVELGESDKAADAITDIERVFAVLGEKDPLANNYSWHNIRVQREHWTEQDWWKRWGKDEWEQKRTENEVEYLKLKTAHDLWASRQKSARLALDGLGGVAKHVDAKLDWEDAP